MGMSQQILEKLFDSPTKLRLLKLFLRNPGKKFSLKDIREKTLLKTAQINKELKKLEDIKIIQIRKQRGKRDKLFQLNMGFIFIKELQNLILKSSPTDQDKMTQKLRGLGGIKLAVLSGVFIRHDNEDVRADLLLVGDRVNDKRLAGFMKNLEAEAGTEIDYAVFDNEEFQYRQKMFDRFLRDILEKPHKKLINKIIK
ncbi:MAG: hypothetical protein A3F94_01330 [Candidatus Spechtbacteria bacterium RIFCSPLOWO2_12_FULL_38_22]|uniref:HTH arsR-type domain-containing protein n=1 Tax=Candidatus Spechtbacteria bacterium RIFCSPLOWO2_12_FULL_38_22 TaxID=1802165 RepID=A0A1G2HHE6_9BACT|nr:MAG: hypothetical protein A2728_02335 [Candidatus Spechtbacteria bacterium RIFCSPHIGHO2_01_FULL_38_11]OGZ59949.1 MAG: hypothetical protein A3E58_00990 [Candidatus Spechtbacteria bacterium RIFCSPHIGHO2_12_FULL_38_30]OGZ60550.1 MAG: hypothetical protein A3A00_02750 [Candidatus Spechtbacteria bacterium RIFCSPLOWO2_01_FULL_38_20]OGZ61809.1 MAG: hypothetical protein A3F94_01330 [Candidatus Spechtbacteria bacterium RIFCSPLOWO2_12_FULL_38_22]